MTATIHSLRAGPPDPLADLFAERERLGQELQRLAVVDTRLAEAEGRLAETEAGIAAVDRADVEQMRAWADAGEGEAPQPLISERRALIGRRLDAQADVDAARVAVDAVAARRVELIHAMNAVGARIRERQVAAALDEARGLHREALALAADVGGRMMKVQALQQTLADAQGEALARRDDAQAAIFRAALSDAEKLRAPQVLADPATVARFTAEWKGAMR